MATTARKYKKVSCHKTKTAAKKVQKKLHGQNKTAKVVKTSDGYCVESAGKRKTKKKKK